MKKIPYGTSNFRQLISQGYFYIDRSSYIRQLEQLGEKYIAYLRPRRFGKSLWISTLHHYYGLEYQDQFETLFGDVNIGHDPTPLANQYLVLTLDFSGILTDTLDSTYTGFLENVKLASKSFMETYSSFFPQEVIAHILSSDAPNVVMTRLFQHVSTLDHEPQIYILIDEYDHFANELIAFHFDDFQEVVSRNGYVRKFYEALKIGTGQGVVDRIFLTGVSPITLDSFTSGFNIASNLTGDLALHEMMGFTHNEVEQLMQDIGVAQDTLPELMLDLKQWYNGYLFHAEADTRIYNPNMVLYFALNYQKYKKYPERLLDTNIATDYGKLHRMFRIGEENEKHYEVIESLLLEKQLSAKLTTQYSFEKRFSRDDFISLLFYLGMISIKSRQLDQLQFQQPNYVIGELYYDYFREIILRKAGLSDDQLLIRNRIITMAQDNNPMPFIEAVEQVLKTLSNRDSMSFDEKHVKAIITSLLYTSGIYTIKNEYETEKQYIDVLLTERPPIQPRYTFAFELKYLKKSEASKLESVREAGMKQLRQYLQHEEFQQMENLQGWLFVFIGSEAKAIVNVSDM